VPREHGAVQLALAEDALGRSYFPLRSISSIR